MWVKRSEWIQILTNSSEHRVRAELLQTMSDGWQKTNKELGQAYQVERTKLVKALARIDELEEKILELNDALNVAKKSAQVPLPLNVAEMFDDEDPVKVEELRKRIKSEGADAILVEEMEM
jgi:hypothetical protein